MGKQSLLGLMLLFCILLFHAKARMIPKLKSTNSLHLQEDSPDKVEKWYSKLDDKRLFLSKLNFFFHANANGSDPNQVQVAKSFTPINPSWFGMVQAFDYPLTAKHENTSEPWGYGQGFFLESSKEEFSAMLGMNLLLTKFSNSTLTLLGQDPFNDKYRELAVIGGTGYFRLATGSAIMYNHYHVTGVAIVELTIFVRHYIDPLMYKVVS